MHAADIMSRDVVTATPDADVQEIAGLMVKHRLRCVPILHNDRVVGIISESDLMRRMEIGSGRTHSRLSDLFASAASRAAEYVRTHSRRAADLMTRDVVAVPETAELAEVARLLDERKLRQVLVVDADTRLVGIVARANLVEAVARSEAPVANGGDAVIRDRLMAELQSQVWADGARPAEVVVHDGTVYLWGRVASPAVRQALAVAAANIPGVKAVENNLTENITFDPLDRPHWNDTPPI
ncbi:MAG TPA: CBS domain-containing protein [Acetobacteraceae bacterium]|jgi:CBS domain-containing protein|nr:CBS domain-containing protein [Acetobacteraceae bacterium]